MKESKPLAPLNHPQHRDMTWRYRRLYDSLLLSAADTMLLESLRPRCAVCKHLVDKFSWMRAADRAAIVFNIECHGAITSMAVGFDDLPIVMLGGVHGAEVFGETKCINGQPRDRDATDPRFGCGEHR
jgi:hypothetical protein